MFKPERAIETLDQDLLQRAPFAKSLAESIISYRDKDSIVLGLYGKWGTGKSSTINMCIDHIETITDQLKEDEKPIIVRFNPWNFADQSQLLIQFFQQLSNSIQHYDSSDRATKLAGKIIKYALFFVPLALIAEPGTAAYAAGQAGSTLKKFGDRIKSAFAKDKNDFTTIRKEINDLLSEWDKKLIVVIDDIDRLNNIEIRQIFQLVKLIGDFPNTVYLLSFDRDIVIESLKNKDIGNGHEYLEKIIQVPFVLPDIDKEDVEIMLEKQIQALSELYQDALWDPVYLQELKAEGFIDFFHTLRDITRYMNTIKLAISSVAREINAADFMAITAIKVFEPDVYEGIRGNKDIFTYRYKESMSTRQEEAIKIAERCDEIINRVSKLSTSNMRNFLEFVFPSLYSFYSHTQYTDEFYGLWRRDQRICSPEKFDIYFKLKLSKNELSESKIKSILASGCDEEKFTLKLNELIADKQIHSFITRFKDYVTEIPKQDIKPIASALINIADYLNEDQHLFNSDPVFRIIQIILPLIKRINKQNERHKLIEESFTNTNSIYAPGTLIEELMYENGELKSQYRQPIKNESDRVVSDQQLLNLKNSVVVMIKDAAKDSTLEKHKYLRELIFLWKKLAINGDADVKSYIQKVFNSDIGLATILSALVNTTTSHGGARGFYRDFTFSLDALSHFFDVQKCAKRVRNIMQGQYFNQMLKEHQEVLKLFIDTVDGKIKESDF